MTQAPDEEVVGHYFAGNGGLWYCDSYDPAQGFWMTNIEQAGDRRNVSERAIGRTFHHIWEDAGGPYTALQGWTGQERYKVAVAAHRETLYVNRLAQEMDMSPTAVRKSLANLQARGLIQKLP